MRFLARMTLITAATLLASAAQAGVIDWNFTYTAGGVTTSGMLVTAGTVDSTGGYDVLGITGKRGGQIISGLLSPNANFNDNEIFTSGPKLDQLGLGFNVGWQSYDVYYNSQGGCGPSGYREDNGADYPYCNPSAPAVTNFSITRAVPEPAMIVLMAFGLALVLLGRRAAKRALAKKSS